MSTTIPPTDRDTLERAFRGLDLRPLQILDSALAFTETAGLRTVELAWDGQKQRFVIAYQSIGTPKRIEYAARDVRALASEMPGARPLLIAPFLSAEKIERLLTQGISSVDLSGNFGIVVPKRWFVMRTGNKNGFPSSAHIKNVYRGVSSLVPRALLTRGSFASATEIQRDIERTRPITPSTISKVLSSLREDLLIAQDGEIRVLQPAAILAQLARNYTAAIPRKKLLAKLTLDAAATATMNRNAAAKTMLYAIDGTSLYTVIPSTNPVTRIYTDDIASITTDLTLDTKSRFPDVEFIETAEPATFYGREMIEGAYRTSLLQVYLDLQAGSSREKQNAESLRARLISGSKELE